MGWKVRKAKDERGLRPLEIHLLKLRQQYILNSIITIQNRILQNYKEEEIKWFPFTFYAESTTNIKY